jgi:hypothetical protein
MSTTTGEGGGWPGATGGSVSSGAAAPVVIAEPVPTEFTQATSTAYLLAKHTHIKRGTRTHMHTRGRSSGSQLTEYPLSHATTTGKKHKADKTVLAHLTKNKHGDAVLPAPSSQARNSNSHRLGSGHNWG